MLNLGKLWCLKVLDSRQFSLQPSCLKKQQSLLKWSKVSQKYHLVSVYIRDTLWIKLYKTQMKMICFNSVWQIGFLKMSKKHSSKKSINVFLWNTNFRWHFKMINFIFQKIWAQKDGFAEPVFLQFYFTLQTLKPIFSNICCKFCKLLSF